MYTALPPPFPVDFFTNLIKRLMAGLLYASVILSTTYAQSDTIPENMDWESYADSWVWEAYMLYDSGEYRRSLDTLQSAFLTLDGRLQPTAFQIAEMHHLSGSASYELGYYLDAIRHFKKALVTLNAQDSSDHEYLAHIYDLLGSVYAESGDADEGLQYYKQSIAEYNLHKSDREGLLSAKYNLSLIHI